MVRLSNLSFILLCLSLLLTTGCSDPHAGRSAVSGTITIDGEPLELGVIFFQPEKPDPNAAVKGAQVHILNGKYSIDAGLGLLEGDYRVRINAEVYKDVRTGKFVKETEGIRYEVIELVPKKYNEESEVIFTVGKKKRMTFNFDVKTKD